MKESIKESKKETKKMKLGKNEEEQNNQVPDTYADETPLVKIFGDHPKARIISALLSEKEYDINISDLARLSGASRSSIYDHIDELIEMNIVKKTRKSGNSQMYAINTDDELVQKIEETEAQGLKRLLKIEDKI